MVGLDHLPLETFVRLEMSPNIAVASTPGGVKAQNTLNRIYSYYGRGSPTEGMFNTTPQDGYYTPPSGFKAQNTLNRIYSYYGRGSPTEGMFDTTPQDGYCTPPTNTPMARLPPKLATAPTTTECLSYSKETCPLCLCLGTK
jgi:hypothetical protein